MKKSNTSHRLTLTTLVAVVTLTAGCANLNERQNTTLKGAAIGAASGAVLGSVTGGNAGTGVLVGGAVGALAGNLWSRRLEEKQAAMQAATAGTGVSVERTNDNQLRLNVPSDISFPVNSSQLMPGLRPLLDQFAAGLDGRMLVRVIGHTDSSGSDAINLPLSVQRAQSVRDYLVVRGVPSERILIDGVGSSKPVADNTTEAGRARNRRVEVLLSDNAN